MDSVRPMTLEDVVGLERYERDRAETRRRIIDLKKLRRFTVGDCVTFVFENYHTVFFQVHEMLRAERISDLDKIREELEVYNALLPAPGQLSATMLIEITEQDRIEERLLELIGVDECVRLVVGKYTVAGAFEAGRSREDRISAVQYVRFPLSDEARVEFGKPDVAVCLEIDHPRYRARAAIEGAPRAELAGDLGIERCGSA